MEVAGHGRSTFRVLTARFVFEFGSLFAGVAAVGAVVLFPFSRSPVFAAVSDDGGLLDRVSGYVERYYQRTQTLVATETVVIQPLAPDMSDFGPARRVVNELRIEWQSGSSRAPRTMRQVMSTKGPWLGPPDKPDCFDPRSLSPEPLAFLLPANRHKFRFSVGRTDVVDGVPARRISYEALTREPLRVDWQGKCGTIRTPSQTRGFVWVDPGSGEILRFDEHLARAVNLPGPPGPDGQQAPRSFRMERDDTLIDYKRFAFTDPDETVLLPSRVESLTVIRNSAVPRVRTTVTLTDYRRFLTGGRVVQ